MCPILQSQTPVRSVSRRPQTTAFPRTAPSAETDRLLRDLAYVFHLAERVRASIAEGEELLPAGV
jgi:hypothetical protein